ncbi:MAG: energy-coupling factor transporter transmembrane protein EcfT [Caldilineales bacterium]|nr:energy-coupling factor transporter transmembrane protein EcfT [Caldilineales bacterium]
MRPLATGPADDRPPLHPLAWLVWLGSVLAALTATRNPVYLALALGCIGLAHSQARRRAYAPPPPLSPLRFGLVVVPLGALLNALSTHYGETVVLTFPRWLPLIGGPITLEALVYGGLNGLVLTGLFAAFTALYLGLSVQALVRLIPRAFYPVAVVLSIALAYVPTTFAQLQQIREAQTMRGYRPRGLRDALPLVMPLLVSGLENALHLAEAMTARGFGSAAAPRPRLARPLQAAGLVGVVSALILRLAGQQSPAVALLLAGGAVLVAVGLWLQGRSFRRTVYRPQPVTPRDLLVAMAAAATAVFYLAPTAARVSLAYTPYPRLSPPPVDWAAALATLGLVAPGLALAVFSRRQSAA